MIAFYSNNLLFQRTDQIEKIEICLGGDHGKRKFIFMAIVAIRYKKESGLEPLIKEYQIGQIDHSSDNVELLRPLLKFLEPGIRALKANGNSGSGTFCITESAEGKKTLCFGSSATAKFNIGFKLFLIGDLKFLAMVLGREGFCGAWCMYCKLKKAQWVKCIVTGNPSTAMQTSGRFLSLFVALSNKNRQKAISMSWGKRRRHCGHSSL